MPPIRALPAFALAAALLASPATPLWPRLGDEAGSPPPAAPVPSPGPPVPGSYAWPVRGPVIRGFELPPSPYGAGHRGIDIGVPPGTPVRSAREGTVAFAGRVAGYLHVSVDHPDGVRTSYSWVSGVVVAAGDEVARGEVLGATGGGHPGDGPAHLHFGARVAGIYIDPMLLLEAVGVAGLIRLAPLGGEHP